jgi:hypothetical protein
VGRPAAELRCHELDRESGDPVADATGQRQRERPQVQAPGGHGQTASHYYDEPDDQRDEDAEADVRTAARRLPDDEESGHADGGGADTREHDRIPSLRPWGQHACVPSHGPPDQYGEDQVKDQKRLDEREAPEVERHNLQGESDEVRGDGGQPQRLPDQIQQDRGRQRPPGLDPLGAALVGDGRHSEEQRRSQGGPYGDRRGQLSVLPSAGSGDPLVRGGTAGRCPGTAGPKRNPTPSLRSMDRSRQGQDLYRMHEISIVPPGRLAG